jgi:hypothetical protein
MGPQHFPRLRGWAATWFAQRKVAPTELVGTSSSECHRGGALGTPHSRTARVRFCVAASDAGGRRDVTLTARASVQELSAEVPGSPGPRNRSYSQTKGRTDPAVSPIPSCDVEPSPCGCPNPEGECVGARCKYRDPKCESFGECALSHSRDGVQLRVVPGSEGLFVLYEDQIEPRRRSKDLSAHAYDRDAVAWNSGPAVKARHERTNRRSNECQSDGYRCCN